MPLQPEKKNNVTKFRPDRRMLYVNFFKGLALAGFLVLTVFFIWTYREDLNASNFRRILSFLDSRSAEGGAVRDFAFEQGLDTVYLPLDIGMATYSGGNYNFLSAYSTGDFTHQLNYASAVMTANDKKVLIYDRGGKRLALANSYSLLREVTLDSPIVSASLNGEGAYSAVTNQTDYRSALTVWDSRDEQIFQWKTARHYLLLSSVSPGEKQAAVLALGQSAGVPDYSVKVFDLKSGEQAYELQLGEDRVYAMGHCDDRLMLLCASGLRYYDRTGQLRCRVDFSEKPLIAWDLREGQLPLVALQGEAGAELYVWDLKGRLQVSAALDSQDLAACRHRGGTLAVLYEKNLYLRTADGTEHRAPVREVRDICLTADGRLILVWSGKAAYYNIDATEE